MVELKLNLNRHKRGRANARNKLNKSCNVIDILLFHPQQLQIIFHFLPPSQSAPTNIRSNKTKVNKMKNEQKIKQKDFSIKKGENFLLLLKSTKWKSWSRGETFYLLN